MGSSVLGQFQLHREQPWGVVYWVNLNDLGQRNVHYLILPDLMTLKSPDWTISS